MAWQSSRIIWDKNKTDSSEPQPVTIYDPTGTIYVAGNYALHSDHSGSVAEDYQLYLCKVEETGSSFVSSDWELQKGVKNWYLMARRQFKKGARVIKSDTNGDTASLRLYKCISSMKQPNVWNPDEWEVVYQDVGVAYEVRDHKDVYYDSGSNRNKWHKMMYYLLPENPDKSDEEIEIFSEDRVYHKDDYVIKVKNNNEVALFKYISNTPRAGWDLTRWSEDVSVAEYEANIPYNKGDWIIRKYIEIYEFVIMEFQAGLRYYNGKYCLHIINPDDINPDIPVFNENVTYSRGDRVSYNRGLWEYNLNIPLSGPWIPAYWDNIGKTFPDWYRERILGGESLYGLYRANTTVCGSWNDNEWDLIIDGVIQIRGRDYNTRGLCIMQFQIGQDYLAGDVVIWTATNDTSEFGLSVAKVDIYNCSPAQAPPNETNWNNITETLENPDQYHVYKAKANMTAGYNSHFRRDDWLIVTQKILPDDGLYGVIWEKYGKPTGGGGIPFFIFIPIQDDYYGGRYINGWVGSTVRLYPFMGNNVLEKDLETSCYWTEGWSGDICVTDLYYTNNKIYGFMGNMSNNYYFYFFMLGKWYKNHLMELINYGNLRTTDNHVLYFYPTGSYTHGSSDYKTKGKLQKIIPSLYDNSDATIIDLYTTPENMSTTGGYYPEYQAYYTTLSKPFYKYEEVLSAYPYDWWVMQPLSLTADRPSVKITAADIHDDGSIVDRNYSRLYTGGTYLYNYYGQASGYVAGFGFYDKWTGSPYSSLMAEELTAAGLTLVRATSSFNALATTSQEIEHIEDAVAKARKYGYEAITDYETYEPYVYLEIKVPVLAILNGNIKVYDYASKELIPAGSYKEGNTTYRIYCRRITTDDYGDTLIKKYVVKYAITDVGKMSITSVSTDPLLYDILYNLYGNSPSGGYYDEGYWVYSQSSYEYIAVMYKNIEWANNQRYADYDNYKVNLKTLTYNKITNIKLYWEIKYYGNPSKFTIANKEYKKVIALLGYPYIRPKAMKNMDLEDTYIYAAYYITPVKAVSNGGGISTLGYVYWDNGLYDVTCVLFHNFPFGTYVDGFIFKNSHGNYNNDGPIYGGPGYNGFSGW